MIEYFSTHLSFQIPSFFTGGYLFSLYGKLNDVRLYQTMTTRRKRQYSKQKATISDTCRQIDFNS